jgi:Ca2+/Na+ antiporter
MFKKSTKIEYNVMNIFFQLSWLLMFLTCLLLWKEQYTAVYCFLGLYFTCFVGCYIFFAIKNPELLRNKKHKIINVQTEMEDLSTTAKE